MADRGACTRFCIQFEFRLRPPRALAASGRVPHRSFPQPPVRASGRGVRTPSASCRSRSGRAPSNHREFLAAGLARPSPPYRMTNRHKIKRPRLHTPDVFPLRSRGRRKRRISLVRARPGGAAGTFPPTVNGQAGHYVSGAPGGRASDVGVAARKVRRRGSPEQSLDGIAGNQGGLQ